MGDKDSGDPAKDGALVKTDARESIRARRSKSAPEASGGRVIGALAPTGEPSNTNLKSRPRRAGVPAA
jgi:hypothetical protein